MSQIPMRRMTPIDVAAVLREQAGMLEKAHQEITHALRPIEWKTGITRNSKVAIVARRACAVWAWIVRRDFAKGFVGGTHALDLGQRRAVTPWARLDSFSDWASGLPGIKGGKPCQRGGHAWVWSLGAVADWLDSEARRTRTQAVNSDDDGRNVGAEGLPSAHRYRDVGHKARILRIAKDIKLPPDESGPHERELTAFLRQFNSTPYHDQVIEAYVRLSRPDPRYRDDIRQAAKDSGLSDREWKCRETLVELKRFVGREGWATVPREGGDMTASTLPASGTPDQPQRSSEHSAVMPQILLNDSPKLVLIAALELKAFNMETKQKAKEILARAFSDCADYNNYKDHPTALAKVGLFKVLKQGRSSGYWLSEDGVYWAKYLKDKGSG